MFKPGTTCPEVRDFERRMKDTLDIIIRQRLWPPGIVEREADVAMLRMLEWEIEEVTKLRRMGSEK
jgi:hypothetical protein